MSWPFSDDPPIQCPNCNGTICLPGDKHPITVHVSGRVRRRGTSVRCLKCGCSFAALKGGATEVIAPGAATRPAVVAAAQPSTPPKDQPKRASPIGMEDMVKRPREA